MAGVSTHSAMKCGDSESMTMFSACKRWAFSSAAESDREDAFIGFLRRVYRNRCAATILHSSLRPADWMMRANLGISDLIRLPNSSVELM